MQKRSLLPQVTNREVTPIKTLYLYAAHDVDDFRVITSIGLKAIIDSSGFLGDPISTLDDYGLVLNESSIASEMMNALGITVRCYGPSWREFDSDPQAVTSKMSWRSLGIVELADMFSEVTTQLSPDRFDGDVNHAAAGAWCNLILGDIVTDDGGTDPHSMLIKQAASGENCAPFKLVHLEYGCSDHKLWNHWIGD